MRGVAANLLWGKATDYKMKKDWTNLGATLNQITKVQPNFINVWTNQAWNLSYNVSVEFDDYRQRYRWVIKGFNFLDEGIKYNKDQPRLLWEMGRMVSQKIGKADESKQYRRLFKADDQFHGSRPPELRDNWLVGKDWYERSIEMIDDLNVPVEIADHAAHHGQLLRVLLTEIGAIRLHDLEKLQHHRRHAAKMSRSRRALHAARQRFCLGGSSA